MYPPLCEDWQLWMNFRETINKNLRLKYIVKHNIFVIVTALLTLLAAINSIFYINLNSSPSSTFDTIFIWMFFGELVVRLIGAGPEVFFSDRWNCIDAIMIILNVIFYFVTTDTKFDEFIKIFRFFRIIGVIKIILCSRYITRKRIEII